ncbi:hypothetical protein [Lutibacter sp.]|uniref:hypothetical protein n=1 Tax=Lutibacter sp. TaxID=1925666 RepID=UPI0025C3CC7C|nr:hypothetical protein [Lutibacter sp.]MCF6181148.1 hypothetical protein [Lutibacter sp.]
MIQYLKRNKIDIELYDACIQKSMNSRVYAFSWYLDCVADNWDVLVLNNYEAVMPLPWRRKIRLKYLYPPAWTQQLGIFSKENISEKLVLDFLDSIPKKFIKITVQLNSENSCSLLELEEKTNFILPLNTPKSELIKGFNKNRKRALKRAKATSFQIEKNINLTTFLNFYLGEDKDYELTLNQIETLNNLLKSNHKSIHVWGVKIDNQLVTGFVWLKSANRITYLLPIATLEAKQKGLPTLLISELINEFSNSEMILDLEGSMIKGVADFYKSFSAKKEVYYNFLKYNFL